MQSASLYGGVFLVFINSFTFSPYSVEQLSEHFGILTPNVIEKVNSALEIDEYLDGQKGLSEIEKAVYLTAGLGNNKLTKLNGLYFLKKNYYKNPNKKYLNAISKLTSTLSKTYGATSDEIGAVVIKAMFDHLLENNKNAKRLVADLGKERGEAYILAIAKCYWDRSKVNKDAILELAKTLVPEKPPFPQGTFDAFQALCDDPLNDGNLYNTLTRIIQAYTRGESLRDVQLKE